MFKQNFSIDGWSLQSVPMQDMLHVLLNMSYLQTEDTFLQQTTFIFFSLVEFKSVDLGMEMKNLFQKFYENFLIHHNLLPGNDGISSKVAYNSYICWKWLMFKYIPEACQYMLEYFLEICLTNLFALYDLIYPTETTRSACPVTYWLDSLILYEKWPIRKGCGKYPGLLLS